MADLVVAEGASDHVCDQIALIIPLVVADAYHYQLADYFVIRINWLLNIDPFDPPTLPPLMAEGQGETFLSGREDGSKLPAPTLDARGGIRGGRLLLPTMSLAAEGDSDHLAQLSGRLPTVSLSARCGFRGGNMKLPAAGLSISVTGDLIGRLDKNMPGLSLSATGAAPVLGSLSRRLPAFTLAVTMSGTASGTLIKDLPTLKLTAGASLTGYGTLDRIIPAPVMTAATSHQSSLEASLTLPTLLMAVLGAGAGGLPGPAPSTIQNASRFTDYILRYSR